MARPRAGRASQLWVRINPLDSGLALADLAAVVAADPDGVMLPKADGPEDVRRLSHYLDALEAQHGLEPGSIRIVPVATETAIAPFRLGEYASAGLSRLMGLTWGAEDLAAALGASTNLAADGQWAQTYQLARSLTLLAARAAGVQAIDTLYVNFKDEPGLRASSRASRAEGFTGRPGHPSGAGRRDQRVLPALARGDRAREARRGRLRCIARGGYHRPRWQDDRHPAPEAGAPCWSRRRPSARDAAREGRTVVARHHSSSCCRRRWISGSSTPSTWRR
ncbi:MAG: aldolase/citrate lyase family protein [Steroidobacteraceae bacterium]